MRRLAILGVVASVLIWGAIRLHAFINIQDLLEYAKVQEESLIDIKKDGEVHVTYQAEEVAPSVENIAELLAVVKNTDTMTKNIIHFNKKISAEEIDVYYSLAWEDRDFSFEGAQREGDVAELTNERKHLQFDANDFLEELAIFDWDQHKNFFSFVSKLHMSEYTGDLFYRDKEEIIAKLKNMSPEEYEKYIQSVHYLLNGKKILENVNLFKKVF